MRQLHLKRHEFHQWERVAARVVSLGWGVFWAWFGFASGAAEYASVGDVAVEMMPGLLFLAVALLAWKHPAPGGALLMALAIVTFTAYWAGTETAPSVHRLGPALLLSLPPLASGALFLSSVPPQRSDGRMGNRRPGRLGA